MKKKSCDKGTGYLNFQKKITLSILDFFKTHLVRIFSVFHCVFPLF